MIDTYKADDTNLVKGGLSLKIKDLLIHQYFIATKYL